MTLSDPADDVPCDHTQDWFDEWDDVYELALPEIHLTRICDDCGAQEEYRLQPDPDDGFEQDFGVWEERQMNGEIADVSVRIDREMSDGINAYAYLTIERGEGTGVEIVREKPYYFFY